MTSRERLRAALRHTQPDRVPLDIGGSSTSTMTTGAYEKLKPALGIDAPTRIMSRRLDLAFVDQQVRTRLEVDTYPLVHGAPQEAVTLFADGSYRDEWGVVRRRAPGGHYYVSTPPLATATTGDLSTYPWPDPEDPGWVWGLREEAERVWRETDCALVLTLPVGFGHQSQFLRGFEAWLVDCAADPQFAGMLMDRVLDVQMRIVDRLLATVGDRVEAVLYADDLASQDRALLSPSMYRKLIKPRQKRYLDFVKSRTDARVLYHSCGAVYPLIPDLIEIGVDILNPIQTSAAGMDPVRLKREFGRDLAFWGGVDIQHLLPRGRPEEITCAVERLVDVLGAGGGYVLSAAHNIQADTPPENVMAMLAGRH